jgi:MraZ protein
MDTKGRVSLPAKHRKVLPEELVAIRSPHSEFPSLRVYSEADYDAWVARMLEAKGVPADDAELDLLSSDLNAQVVEVKVDTMGRVLIPAQLRQVANLTSSVAVRGAGDHVELWDPQVLENYLASRSTINVFSSSR